MSATVTPERGASYTSYKITGPLDAVFKAIALVFSEYHPFGYSTKVRSISMESDGTYTAEMWRANSCD